MTTTLHPLPVRYPPLRTNLCVNGSFEYGIDGWIGQGTMLLQADGAPYAGTIGDFVLRGNKDGAGTYVRARSAAAFATVQTGQWVGIRAWLTATSNTPWVQALAVSTAGFIAAQSAWTEVTDIATGTFVQAVGQHTAVPVGLDILLRATADPAAPAAPDNAPLLADQVIAVVGDSQAEVEAALASYLDGDTPDTATRVYEWEGPPGQSISTEGDATADPVGTVSPKLVLEPQHETQTNVTVHRPLAGGAPTAILRAPGLPEGTFRFLCADRATAQQLEGTCDGSATVHIDSTAVPGTPFEFAPHGAVRARQNVPFQSWTVDVPYVRLT